MTRQVEIQQREVSTKAGRPLTAQGSYIPERDYRITKKKKKKRINPHASVWEITEGYEDKAMDVCTLKNEEYRLCAV